MNNKIGRHEKIGLVTDLHKTYTVQ
jgi:hypothetical protein